MYKIKFPDPLTPKRGIRKGDKEKVGDNGKGGRGM